MNLMDLSKIQISRRNFFSILAIVKYLHELFNILLSTLISIDVQIIASRAPNARIQFSSCRLTFTCCVPDSGKSPCERRLSFSLVGNYSSRLVMVPFLNLSNYIISSWGHWRYLTRSALKASRNIDSSVRGWTAFSGESSLPMRTDVAEFDGEFNPVPNGIEGEKDWGEREEESRQRKVKGGKGRSAEELRARL